MFEQEELQAMLNLLNRVTINGNEAETVVFLKNKLKGLIVPKKDKKEK